VNNEYKLTSNGQRIGLSDYLTLLK